jgi:hypothetical protein
MAFVLELLAVHQGNVSVEMQIRGNRTDVCLQSERNRCTDVKSSLMQANTLCLMKKCTVVYILIC